MSIFLPKQKFLPTKVIKASRTFMPTVLLQSKLLKITNCLSRKRKPILSFQNVESLLSILTDISSAFVSFLPAIEISAKNSAYALPLFAVSLTFNMLFKGFRTGLIFPILAV